MLPFNNLPDNSKVDWFMQPTATNEVHTWTKPVGCNFVYIVAAGGGGYGGNGFTRAAGVAGGGGGGGGSSQLITMLVPAFLLPDTLFIKVGTGGKNATSTSAFPTIISAYRVTSATEYYLASGNGLNGSNGTTSAGGTGSGATIPAITNQTLGTIGKWQGVSSLGGSAGGISSGSNGNGIIFNYFLTGGCGGASTTSGDYAGGSVVSSFNQPSALTVVSGGAIVANATAGQNDGGDGYFIPKRFASYGGAGGGASNNGVGGRGGKGGPGSGGGGGGAGTTGGAGGDGGDGFAVIISY